MSATTSDRLTKQWGGTPMTLGEWPVKAAEKIPGGVLTARNTSGYAVNASDAASLTFAGVAVEAADNTNGAPAAITVQTHRRGVFLFANGDAIAAADIGKVVYVADNQTVVKADPGHTLKCGKVAAVESAGVWVEIDSAVDANAATS